MIDTIKNLGAIGKRKSENDLVWITLQFRQFNWKKVNITKVKGDGTDAMSILYNIPNHRETFLKLDTVQDIEKKTTYVTVVVILPLILGPIFCDEEEKLWDFHKIVKSGVEPKDREVKRFVCPILED